MRNEFAEIVYPVMPTTTERLEKRRLSSLHVTLDALSISEDGMATAKLSFDDPAKLKTVEMFGVQVENPEFRVSEAIAQIRDAASIGRHSGRAVEDFAAAKHFFRARRMTAICGQR